MAKNFQEIAFTEEVRKIQERMGSRAAYARVEKENVQDGLTEGEIAFIEERDSFYVASIGSGGYPYIQHRGGPKGFLKVIDHKTLGFIDFKGNMQFITQGNLETNNKVALILVDYPAKTRLKLYATARKVALGDDPQLLKLLDLKGYKHRPEHIMILDVDGYDWNCPQHIVPRYTEAEIAEMLEPLHQKVLSMEAEIKTLKNQLNKKVA